MNEDIKLEKRYLSIIRPVIRSLIASTQNASAQDIRFQFHMHYNVRDVTTQEYVAAMQWMLNNLDAAENMIDESKQNETA